MASKARMKLVEQLLVESSGNNPRTVVEGSVRLIGGGAIDWTERTKRGLVARSAALSNVGLWDLIDASLNPYGKEANHG